MLPARLQVNERRLLACAGRRWVLQSRGSRRPVNIYDRWLGCPSFTRLGKYADFGLLPLTSAGCSLMLHGCMRVSRGKTTISQRALTSSSHTSYRRSTSNGVSCVTSLLAVDFRSLATRGISSGPRLWCTLPRLSSGSTYRRSHKHPGTAMARRG